MPTLALNFGSSKAGMNSSLRANALNSVAVVLSTISSGFTEIGNGEYLFNYTTLPTTTVALRFYSTIDGVGESYCTLALDETATIPADGNPDTVTAYLYTRNSSGMIVPNTILFYQVVGSDPDFGDTFNDDVQEIESDATGLVEIQMVLGLHYRYWIGSGRFKTVHITDATPDPYPLPEVQG